MDIFCLGSLQFFLNSNHNLITKMLTFVLIVLLGFWHCSAVPSPQPTDGTPTVSPELRPIHTWISFGLPTPSPPPAPVLKWTTYEDMNCQQYLGEYVVYEFNFTTCQPFPGNSILIEMAKTDNYGEDGILASTGSKSFPFP